VPILHIQQSPLRSAFIAAQRQADRMSRPPDLWDDPAPAAANELRRPRTKRRKVVAVTLVGVALVAAALAVAGAFSGAALDPGGPEARSANDPQVARVAGLPMQEAPQEFARQLPSPVPERALALPLEAVSDGVALVRGRVEFDLRNADAKQVLPRLAALTGTNLSGLDALSGVDARITLRGSWRAGLESWKAALEGINSILACSARSCDVWILPAPRQVAGSASLSAPAGPNAAPTPSDEDISPVVVPAAPLAPRAAARAVPSTEESSEN
jgi:hypothetical protein